MNGKDSTLISEAVVRVSYNPKYKSINGLPVNFAIEVSELVLSEYKATLKKRIEALEQFTTESAFASDDFDEEDTWISRKVVLAEIEKEGK